MMKVSKRAKTNLKIAVATATCIFTLATAFTGTLAWFVASKSVSATGMSVTVNPGSRLRILSCYAVRYDGTNGAIAVDVSSGNASITMSEYDSIFTDRNVNTPLFLRMELANFDTTNDLKVTIPCTGSYKTDSKIDPYLSNVVAAKFMTGLKTNEGIVVDNKTWTGNNVTTADVVASYQGMHDHAALSYGDPFVNGNTKQSVLTLTLDAEDAFDEDFIITKQDGTEVVVVFVALDYYVTDTVNLVSSYVDSYNQGVHSLAFESDINKITLGNGGNQ